ncbi:hypothetical protein ACFU6N_40990, partial [Streptomyces sp. NPDC057496]
MFVAELRAQLLAEPELRTAVQEIWPALSPESLLSTLFSSPELLERVGSVLTEAERLAAASPARPRPGSTVLDGGRRPAPGRDRRVARS